MAVKQSQLRSVVNVGVFCVPSEKANTRKFRDEFREEHGLAGLSMKLLMATEKPNVIPITEGEKAKNRSAYAVDIFLPLAIKIIYDRLPCANKPEEQSYHPFDFEEEHNARQ